MDNLRAASFEVSGEPKERPGVWQDYAACLRYDPEIFFPEIETGRQSNIPKRLAEKAINICKEECTVQEDCLTYALRNNEQFGIWGGLTTKQRETLKRRNR